MFFDPIRPFGKVLFREGRQLFVQGIILFGQVRGDPFVNVRELRLQGRLIRRPPFVVISCRLSVVSSSLSQRTTDN